MGVKEDDVAESICHVDWQPLEWNSHLDLVQWYMMNNRTGMKGDENLFWSGHPCLKWEGAWAPGAPRAGRSFSEWGRLDGEEGDLNTQVRAWIGRVFHEMKQICGIAI